ncbi:beta-1,4-glucuronyltransferase 1-like [Chelonus insularis]|uniref:beta-1,4-glucuronyltransferase 1-like n=1 Tax=Chelonus insularis TaxID=460826 RepID=UPI00158DD645|nr:beta-1,4-glucuronyltransferase 1-like [Chelonus insularis]XP_034948039.1 beta-1,4-glucuronyltransferase 1-like [Chelonus insularis]XP_034948128.1 beta-1,4-glucuronyltransferase 1-like [Chelonus insularis]
MRAHLRRLFFFLSFIIFFFFGIHILTGRNLLLPVDEDASLVSSEGQENAQFTLAYAPGTYMIGHQPKNTAACIWDYGLPSLFSYSVNNIIWSPQQGRKGPYRILPFIIRGVDQSFDKKLLPQLTLCTHATADLVYNIVEIIRRWEGPVSLAIFVPGYDAGLAVNLLDRACRCEPEMNKLSVHLIFPANHPPALKNNCPTYGDCTALDLQINRSDTERFRLGMTYPINVARNVAKVLANTSRVLVSDIELLPSEKLASGFSEMIDGQPPQYGLVFVVPVFEIEENERPPKNKKELMIAMKNGVAVYFHRYVCIHCQKFPGITRWMLRPDPGRVKPLIVTRREYPHHRWEPLYIGTQEDPLYNEDMSWEGRQEKMAQMLEMCLLNYHLIILDGAFLVHSPGIKRKLKKINASNIYEHSQEKKNAQIYLSITQNLLKKYPTNKKCRQ